SLFFFHDPAPTLILPLSLHDALPIWILVGVGDAGCSRGCSTIRRRRACSCKEESNDPAIPFRYLHRPEHDLGKDGRALAALRARSEEHTLNSSHVSISYAVFCLKKKK